MNYNQSVVNAAIKATDAMVVLLDILNNPVKGYDAKLNSIKQEFNSLITLQSDDKEVTEQLNSIYYKLERIYNSLCEIKRSLEDKGKIKKNKKQKKSLTRMEFIIEDKLGAIFIFDTLNCSISILSTESFSELVQEVGVLLLYINNIKDIKNEAKYIETQYVRLQEVKAYLPRNEYYIGLDNIYFKVKQMYKTFYKTVESCSKNI
jgi:predicted hydrocarbon binding protein